MYKWINEYYICDIKQNVKIMMKVVHEEENENLLSEEMEDLLQRVNSEKALESLPELSSEAKDEVSLVDGGYFLQVVLPKEYRARIYALQFLFRRGFAKQMRRRVCDIIDGLLAENEKEIRRALNEVIKKK